jgi:hypothetical protein
MRKIYLTLVVLLSVIVLTGCVPSENNSHIKVEVKKNENGQYRFFVDNQEFYLKGAGCQNGDVAAIAANGGNSFRTWYTGEKAVETLDKAHEHGLKVLMGIYITPERHNFDYDDTAQVNKQFAFAKQEVERLKDHPALLGWIIGNELNLQANNMKVYNAVNDISKMIREVDGNHPTTTTLAGINKKFVDYIKVHCTDIDFISVQLYGAIVNLQQYIDNSGWEGPYVVTEWGATGHWEVSRTEWDVPIEPSSKEKALSFIERYKLAIEADPENCMGSCVFFWGQKQERTPTWYGMFLENGNKTETVDAMHFLWKGEWPENRCPSLDSVKLNGLSASDNIWVQKGKEFNAEVFVTDHENDSLTYYWEILPESTDLGVGGDYEERPETHTKVKEYAKTNLMAPEEPGAYRLFIYVTDIHQQSATANIPFFVE